MKIYVLKKIMRLVLFCNALCLLAFPSIFPLQPGVENTLATAQEWAARAEATVRTKVFSNGFTFYFYPKSDTSDVTLRIIYRAGSADEDSDAIGGGLHIIEHMSFKGTTEEGLNLSETDISAVCNAMGMGSVGCGCNANTSFDRTCYLFHAQENNWQVFVRILADWAEHLRIDAEHLNSEMNAVYQEIKLRDIDGSSNIVAQCLPRNHPYASHSVFGYKEKILQTSRSIHSTLQRSGRTEITLSSMSVCLS